MTTRHTAGLLAVLALLVGGYWLSLRGEEERAQTELEAKRLFDFDADSITRMVIRRPGEQVIEGERMDGGGWRIVRPRELQASNPVWNRIAGALGNVRNERSLDAAVAMEAYGLDEPLLELEFTVAGGAHHTLAFGALDPLQKYRYTTLDGGGLMLVTDATVREFDRSLFDLRNRFLLADGAGVPKRVAFTRFKPAEAWNDALPDEIAGAEEQATLEVERHEDGQWHMTRPVRALASQEKVLRLIGEVLFALGEDFVDAPEALEDYGLSPAGARLEVSLEDGRTSIAYLGNYSGSGDGRRLFAKRADTPAVFTVDPAIVDAFPDTPTAFREYRLVYSGMSGLKALDYESGGERFALGLDDRGAWQITEPVAEPSDQRAVSGYLSYLTTAEAISFPGTSLENTGLDAPDFSIHLHYTRNDAPITLHFGGPGPDDESRFATQEGGAIVLVPRLTYDALKTTLFNFRSKHLTAIPKERVTEVGLVFEGATYRFERRDDRWLVRQPEGKVWERQSDMTLLLDALTGVRAEAEESGLEGSFGFDAPILEAELRAGDASGAFTIGNVLPANSARRYASSSLSAAVLHVPQQTIDDVRTALRGVVDRE